MKKIVVVFASLIALCLVSRADITPDANGRFALPPGLSYLPQALVSKMTNGPLYFVNTNNQSATGKLYVDLTTNSFLASPQLPTGRIGYDLPAREYFPVTTVTNAGRVVLTPLRPSCNPVTLSANGGYGLIAGVSGTNGVAIWCSRSVLVSPTVPFSFSNGIVTFATP